VCAAPPKDAVRVRSVVGRPVSGARTGLETRRVLDGDDPLPGGRGGKAFFLVLRESGDGFSQG
jgi:hypothetical protein